MRILAKHQVIPSMSRPANPYDNASCESFLKTLKREEIYASSYKIWSTAGEHRNLHRAVLQPTRLHSALGYRRGDLNDKPSAKVMQIRRRRSLRQLTQFTTKNKKKKKKRKRRKKRKNKYAWLKCGRRPLSGPHRTAPKLVLWAS